MGWKRCFVNEGASVMVAGDTMNPSVRQILDAVEEVPSENVIILPNNGNILPAAQQAAEAADKTVKVVPTTTIPQGIAAILEFQPYRGMDDNTAEMGEAIRDVRTAEITRSARSVTLDGISAEEGQLIGLFERRMVAAGEGLTDTALAILRSAGCGRWGSGDALPGANRLRQTRRLRSLRRFSRRFRRLTCSIIMVGNRTTIL